MQLRYDEDLVEAAVFLCTSGRRSGVPALQIARFHREREKPYAIADPDERNAAFFQLNLDWFREWGLETVLASSVKEFPLLPRQLDLLAVRKARGTTDEGAELYVNDAGQRTGILALRPGRFAQDGPLRDYLRHEFTHLHDMVEPAFGYSPVLGLPGLNSAQQRLARERYRLLWDITIDGRLTAAGHAPAAPREQHAAAFGRAYAFWPAEKQARTFESLWRTTAPRHAELLELIADPRSVRDEHRPAPGASCPLCGFTTFTWVADDSLSPALTNLIAAEFPDWLPEQGLCGRCQKVYQAAENLRLQVVS